MKKACQILCMISGFSCEVDETHALLGSGNFLLMFQDNLALLSS